VDRPSRLRQAAGVSRRVPFACLIVFAAIWTALAIAPRFREDWLLENLLTFIAVPAAVLGWRRFRFSDRAYVQATIFLVLHTIGSHYTYSEVPAGDWVRDAFGLARNHYDRLVHFAFGLLLLRPVRELGFWRGRPGRLAELGFSVAAVSLASVLYELIEWAVAAIADPAAKTAYLGTQGDEWDAQKDMGLALAGAILAAVLEWGLDRWPPRPQRKAAELQWQRAVHDRLREALRASHRSPLSPNESHRPVPRFRRKTSPLIPVFYLRPSTPGDLRPLCPSVAGAKPVNGRRFDETDG
jgi:putative membrane protein